MIEKGDLTLFFYDLCREGFLLVNGIGRLSVFSLPWNISKKLSN
jgi:hypothetical protein